MRTDPGQRPDQAVSSHGDALSPLDGRIPDPRLRRCIASRLKARPCVGSTLLMWRWASNDPHAAAVARIG